MDVAAIFTTFDESVRAPARSGGRERDAGETTPSRHIIHHLYDAPSSFSYFTFAFSPFRYLFEIRRTVATVTASRLLLYIIQTSQRKCCVILLAHNIGNMCCSLDDEQFPFVYLLLHPLLLLLFFYFQYQEYIENNGSIFSLLFLAPGVVNQAALMAN